MTFFFKIFVARYVKSNTNPSTFWPNLQLLKPCKFQIKRFFSVNNSKYKAKKIHHIHTWAARISLISQMIYLLMVKASLNCVCVCVLFVFVPIRLGSRFACSQTLA